MTPETQGFHSSVFVVFVCRCMIVRAHVCAYMCTFSLLHGYIQSRVYIQHVFICTWTQDDNCSINCLNSLLVWAPRVQIRVSIVYHIHVTWVELDNILPRVWHVPAARPEESTRQHFCRVSSRSAKSSRDDHRRRKSYPSHVRFVDHSVLASSPYACSRVILCVTRYVLLCISVSVVRYRHIQNSVSFMHFTYILIFEQGLLVLPPSAPIRYQNEVPSDTCRT